MSLRRNVLQGGMYLAIRQGIGMAIGLVGVLVLTRQIGPGHYGVYAAVLNIFTFLQNLCGWGLNVFIVRTERGAERRVVDQAATLLLVLGCVGALGALVLLPAIASWTHLARFQAVAAPMFLALPFTLVGQAAMAQLERQLAYRTVAMIELAAQVTYYAIALPLAFAGYGVWAPVLGWTCQQALSIGLSFRAARFWPRLCWNKVDVREMIGYGLSFSSSLWIWQLRALVNPLIVGRYGGADAVGYVALAIRLVEYLGFVRQATWRISIAALARLQDSRDRLRQAISEGIRLQLLAMGPITIAFLWLAPVVVPRLFGARWIETVSVLPFIALAYLANAMFNMHSSALYVLRRNWSVAGFHLVHILLFSISALILVPRLGIRGYGFAELCALTSYLVIDHQVARAVGRPSYGLAMAWGGAFAASLFVHQLGWWPAAALVAVAMLPATWAEIHHITRHFVDLRRAA